MIVVASQESGLARQDNGLIGVIVQQIGVIDGLYLAAVIVKPF